MKNFDRQYRLCVGQGGKEGFEIGAVSEEQPVPLHISFAVQKNEEESQNLAKISVWNLSPTHLAELNKPDCIVTLYAGYGNVMPLIFTGAVTFVSTSLDGADMMTDIELVDSRISIRDTYGSVNYTGNISTKTLIEDAAAQMGIAVSFSYNAEFADLPNGFSYVGLLKNILSKACDSSGLSWSIQNGVLHIKKPSDVLHKHVFLLSPETGLVKVPKRIIISSDDETGANEMGWDVEYLMNAAIGVNDYIRLESRFVQGYFRVSSVEIEGDNLGGTWQCTARLLEV